MKQRLLVSLAVVAAAYMLLVLDGSALETFASVRSSEGSGVSSSFLPAFGQVSLFPTVNVKRNLSTDIWSSPERIISATSDCANPALAIERSTKGLHLAWEEAGEGENTTHYATAIYSAGISRPSRRLKEIAWPSPSMRSGCPISSMPRASATKSRYITAPATWMTGVCRAG